MHSRVNPKETGDGTAQTAELVVLLGPYRNLTTLTAATLSLHPECQVLNHAAVRLLPDNSVNFFETPGQPTFDRFKIAARQLSLGGAQGQYGGSILLSHAYAHADMMQLYRDRYGDSEVKTDAPCLVWKESMRVQRMMMDRPGLIDRLMTRFPRLHFVLPIRAPLDCAVSTSTEPHLKALGLQGNPDVFQKVRAVLDANEWVLKQRDKYPDRIFAFTQNARRPELFRRMAQHLGLSQDGRWIADAMKAFFLRRQYDHPKDQSDFALTLMRQKFAPWPEILDELVEAVAKTDDVSHDDVSHNEAGTRALDS